MSIDKQTVNNATPTYGVTELEPNESSVMDMLPKLRVTFIQWSIVRSLLNLAVLLPYESAFSGRSTFLGRKRNLRRKKIFFSFFMDGGFWGDGEVAEEEERRRGDDEVIIQAESPLTALDLAAAAICGGVGDRVEVSLICRGPIPSNESIESVRRRLPVISLR
ncbi:hypothetical protein BGZ68_003312 [Mortierella alpina]|nr:hypothetical protein BGZ68_003312 [Mortierella alpina]